MSVSIDFIAPIKIETGAEQNTVVFVDENGSRVTLYCPHPLMADDKRGARAIWWSQFVVALLAAFDQPRPKYHIIDIEMGADIAFALGRLHGTIQDHRKEG